MSPSSPTACWWPKPILAAETLEGEGISARVIDMHTVKPLDREAIARAAAETGAIVVAEEHLVDGGLGVRVAQVVGERTRAPWSSWASRTPTPNPASPRVARQVRPARPDVAAAARRAIGRKRK